nr:unnamed protein product [Digitaria exilis]
MTLLKNATSFPRQHAIQITVKAGTSSSLTLSSSSLLREARKISLLLAIAAAALDVGVFHGGGEVVRNGREETVPPEHGVADGDLGEGGGAVLPRAVQEEAAVTAVADKPVGGGRREESEGEVSGTGNRAGEGSRRVRRYGRVELGAGGRDAAAAAGRVAAEDAERRGRGVEAAEAAEEGPGGDDPAEGGARRGGSRDVPRRRQAEEDLRQDVVRERR